MEEALVADAVERGDEEARRLLGLLSSLDHGLPVPGKLGDSGR